MPIKKTTKEEQEKLCAAWRASGLSRKVFCEKKGFSVKTLGSWLRKEKQSAGGVKFMPLKNSIINRINHVEVVLPTGAIVKMQLPIENLSKLIKELL